ncbi:MAG: hypothetical protein AAGI46_12535 [Planctomycetota bacterium]
MSQFPASAESSETHASTPTPPPARWWHWIVEFNPFYLLSAVAMLAGVGALTNTTTWNPIPISRLMPLLGTLQVYEITCLLVSIWLYKQVGPRRDTLQLIALVCLFALDVSFLMSEIATADLAIGILTSAALLALAVAKVALLLRVIRPELTPATIATGLVGLVLLHAVPSTLLWLDGDQGGGVTVGTFYLLWWMVGLSPLLYRLLSFIWRDVAPRGQAPSVWWPRVIAAGPWVSLAIHLGVLHYVYDRPFMAPHAAPLLLCLALLLKPTNENLGLRLLLPLAAAFVSWGSPVRLDLGLGDVRLSTSMIGTSAAWLVLIGVTLPRLLPAAVAAVGGVASWRLLGPSWSQVIAALQQFADAVRALVPRSRFAWGVLSVGMAFVLLLVGVLTSLLHRKPRPSS